MSPKILLVNPVKRPSKRKSPARRARVSVSPAKKAKRHPTVKRVKRNPITAKRKTTMAKKSRRRKLSGAAKSAFLSRMARGRSRRVSANPAPRRRRRGSHSIVVRRNPISFRRRARSAAGRGVQLSQAGIRRVAVPAAIAGVGALGLDILMGTVGKYLPETFRTGTLNSVAKLFGAIAMGVVVSRFGSKQMGEAVAVGGITVTIHDMARALIQQNAPSIPLAGMESNAMGLYDYEALSAYDLGFYNPAMTTDAARGSSLGMFAQQPSFGG